MPMSISASNLEPSSPSPAAHYFIRRLHLRCTVVLFQYDSYNTIGRKLHLHILKNVLCIRSMYCGGPTADRSAHLRIRRLESACAAMAWRRCSSALRKNATVSDLRIRHRRGSNDRQYSELLQRASCILVYGLVAMMRRCCQITSRASMARKRSALEACRTLRAILG